MSLEDEARILLLGFECGVFSHKDVQSWFYNCLHDEKITLEILYDLPYVIEQDDNEVSKILWSCSRWQIDPKNVESILSLISLKLQSGLIDIETALSNCNSLLINNKYLKIDNELIDKVHYFSDGYLLAESNTYGDLVEVEEGFREWLNKYINFDIVKDIKIAWEL